MTAPERLAASIAADREARGLWHDTECAECHQPIGPLEWDRRHDAPEGADALYAHESCCRGCPSSDGAA